MLLIDPVQSYLNLKISLPQLVLKAGSSSKLNLKKFNSIIQLSDPLPGS